MPDLEWPLGIFLLAECELEAYGWNVAWLFGCRVFFLIDEVEL